MSTAPVVRQSGPGGGPAARPRRVGRELDRRAPRAPGDGRAGAQCRERDVAAAAQARSSRAPTPAADRAPSTSGAERVRLRFLPDGAEVRVPSGTPVFDAASWNGIAIDSTCGGHGTCKKCRVRIVSGEVPVGPLDPRAFSADELRDGWRLACRAVARERPGRRGAAAADAPEGGARRGRAPRDPAPGGAEAPRRAGRADDGGPALRPPAACSTRSTTSSRTPSLELLRVARSGAARPRGSTSPRWSPTRS